MRNGIIDVEMRDFGKSLGKNLLNEIDDGGYFT